MLLSPFLTVLALAGLALAATEEYRAACKAVETAISSASNVYYPSDPLYIKGKYHFVASSEQDPACVVEPGTPEDVGEILNVIEATKTPFAVMSGGRASNPGFSSTKGIQIYTGKFSQVTYDAAAGTVVIGTGQSWDNVYQQLQPHNVTVVGGRVNGVGVGGFLLGGGYSYKTNQYGLAIDNIVGYNLVLPNGSVAYVTQSTHSDLFFGLKGGFNNFGIVTDFTMTALPQTDVWGGLIAYSPDKSNEVRAAIADFSANAQDPKAAIVSSFANGQGIGVIIFYDSPTAPPGIFDGFTNIPSVLNNLKTRSYLDMILVADTSPSANFRGTAQMLSVTHFSEALLEAIEDELKYWAARLTPKSGVLFSYLAEPFLQSYLSHSSSPSAFPPPSARQPGKAPNILLAWFAWEDATYDDEFAASNRESIDRLAVVAKAEGLLLTDPPALYGNNAAAETPLVDIYGENLPILQALQAKVDPNNVMGLAGGFKFSGRMCRNTPVDGSFPYLTDQDILSMC